MALKTRKLLLITALIMTSLVPALAFSQQPARMRLIQFVPQSVITLAQARGLFAAEGLDLQITQTASSTEQMGGLSRGTYDIGTTSFDNVLFWSGREGADIVAIAQTVDELVLPFFVRPEIKAWSDLKGKKLAADSVDSAFALTLRRILLSNGLDLKRGDFELIPAGGPLQRVESMKRGDAVAGLINPPFDIQAKAAGLIAFPYQAELLRGYPGSVLVVNQTWARSHRKELVGFLRAWRAALPWAKDPANREAAIKLIVDQAKVNPQAAAQLLSVSPKDGLLNLSGAKTVLDIRSEFAAPPPKGAALEVYVDMSYFQEAAAK